MMFQFKRLNRFFLLLLLFSLITTTSTAIQLHPNNIWKFLQSQMGATISLSQWYIYGKKHFTKTGYERHVKTYTSPVQSSASILRGATGADGVNMEGKVVVITGANQGLGKELATYAASKGAKLYMLCRSPERGEAARLEIAQLTKNDNLKLLLADVGELQQVRKVVQELQAAEPKIDCLVCNAGVLLNDRQETSDGHEVTFASHLLGGSFLLSQLLLPQLKTSSESRVIFVTSGGMLITKFPDWQTVTSTGNEKEMYDGSYAYGYAKRGQVMLAERMARDEPNIKWLTAHPGWTGTNAVDDAFGDNKKYLEPLRNTWQGAEGIAWLMQADRKELENGSLYLDRKTQKKHIAGAFMSEGSYTKNSASDVDEMMKRLAEAAEL